MRVADFDFELPEGRIALRPAKPRDAAKLLIVEPQRLQDRSVRDLPSLLTSGDVLVFNKTKVIPAALSGKRIGRGDAEPHIEALLHQRLDGSRWKAFAKPGKRLAVGDRIRFGAEGRVCLLGTLDARVEEKGEGGEITLAFDFHGPILDEAIATLGDMPLPPYIAGKRETDEQDREDYQTIFAEEEGAVAAPTAGLHFTPDLMKSLQASGIKVEFVTLHVGAGTFLPVKVEDTQEHKMHAEWGDVPEDVVVRLKQAKANGHRVIPVGTTSLRLLESAAASGELAPFRGSTDIFITPGYRFRVADLLFTNFHLPRSTLFMLVSAFSGLERMKAAYAHAIANDYRFYSYGDASLLFPQAT
ncbi:tRNA preQ1(34) S-adenosylmethionine ribosyltransferase-isomerase QueA [Taklimakanibacter deserti]|uniref:tRNA preQ1(34) S-adenosylmethionine ribosyltransferase-isomerase QueA n=1 Tax=Taklimakanibacter deserti TaxID=2267839 RepID=UPI000E65878B